MTEFFLQKIGLDVKKSQKAFILKIFCKIT